MSINKGKELRIAVTNSFNSGILLIVLSGLRTLTILITDILAPANKISVHPKITTVISKMFQQSFIYEYL